MTKEFYVIKGFEAATAISGRLRRLEPGDVAKCDTGQTGSILTIDADSSLFLVDRSTFKTCCKVMHQSAAGI